MINKIIIYNHIHNGALEIESTVNPFNEDPILHSWCALAARTKNNRHSSFNSMFRTLVSLPFFNIMVSKPLCIMSQRLFSNGTMRSNRDHSIIKYYDFQPGFDEDKSLERACTLSFAVLDAIKQITDNPAHGKSN